MAADYATGAKVEYHVIQYGTCYNMAYMETVMLNQAEGGIGAAKSPNWYNKTNGGGLYGKGSSSTVDLNTLWGILKQMLKNHQDIECGETVNDITKKFVPEEQLTNLIKLLQFLQTRDELFVASHVDTLCYKFSLDADPDNWPPLLILMD